MKVNGLGSSKLGQGRNSWQGGKHDWLYSDLLQALKAEHLSALGSQQTEPSFLRLQCPTAGGVLSKPFSLL